MNQFFKSIFTVGSLIIASVCCNTANASDYPNIMVSIKPFYNLCAKVMYSVGEPQLLLKNNASPHDYHLKPSDVKSIMAADLIIWGGPELEGYLQKPIENGDSKKSMDLAKTPGLTLLPLRTSTNWEEHVHNHDGHGHGHGHGHTHDHTRNTYDQHFWLDPNNAVRIANAIATQLSDLDPKHAKTYQLNAANFAKEIKQNKNKWQKPLVSAKQCSFIVFHDAYQYFDNYFGLHGVGSISLNPEIPPSAQRIQQIQDLLDKRHVQCVFSEPQFNAKIIETLTYNLNIYQGQLDPLGSDKDLGPNGYLILIDNLVASFAACGAAASNK